MVEYINTPVTRLGNSSSKNCLKYNRITNCITEIPQDIKLELITEENKIRLKAGSKVYIPNGFNEDGSRKFDVKILTVDSENSAATSSEAYITYFYPNIYWTSKSYSGGTAPSSPVTGAIWYDTINNKVKRYNSNSTWTEGFSLPIGLVNKDFSTVEPLQSIFIFNGFGYIGSCIYVLPGVKGLIPDGFNDDGTLRNIDIFIKNVAIYNMASTIILKNTGRFLITKTGEIIALVGTYDDKSNYNIRSNGEITYGCTYAEGVSLENGRIFDYNPKSCVNLLDRNDTKYIGHQAYPSNKYISLTLGATNTKYTAPADGWFILRKGATDGQFIELYNGANELAYVSRCGSAGTLALGLPAKKGDIVNCSYNASGETKFYKFVYAEGYK